MDNQDRHNIEEPSRTLIERNGDRELIVTRIFNALPAVVFKAWSQAELFQRWWMPKSAVGMSLISCILDVRTGGRYQLEFSAEGSDTFTFYGKYLEVISEKRIVWTNDEADEGAITTVTFEGHDGNKTLLRFHELYPSEAALEEALQGSAIALPEQLDQLGALLMAGSVVD